MTIVRRILPVLLAAVLLSACGETKDVLPEIEQDVKQEVEIGNAIRVSKKSFDLK